MSIKTQTVDAVVGDKLYNIPFLLVDYGGDAVDLTDYSTVKLKVAENVTATSLMIDGTCSVTSAEGGAVAYTVQSGDFSTVGTFPAEVEVTWSSGKIVTFRNLNIKVHNDLGT